MSAPSKSTLRSGVSQLLTLSFRSTPNNGPWGSKWAVKPIDFNHGQSASLGACLLVVSALKPSSRGDDPQVTGLDAGDSTSPEGLNYCSIKKQMNKTSQDFSTRTCRFGFRAHAARRDLWLAMGRRRRMGAKVTDQPVG